MATLGCKALVFPYSTPGTLFAVARAPICLCPCVGILHQMKRGLRRGLFRPAPSPYPVTVIANPTHPHSLYTEFLLGPIQRSTRYVGCECRHLDLISRHLPLCQKFF